MQHGPWTKRLVGITAAKSCRTTTLHADDVGVAVTQFSATTGRSGRRDKD